MPHCYLECRLAPKPPAGYCLVEGPAVDRVTKILNSAIEDAALDKRDGAQRAVAGRMAGQFGEAVFDCAERDAFAGLVGVAEDVEGRFVRRPARARCSVCADPTGYSTYLPRRFAARLKTSSYLRLCWCAILGLNQSAGLLNLSPTNGGTVTDDLDAVIDAVATIEDASGMDQGPRACREGGSRGSGHDRRGASGLRRDHETGPQRR